METSGRASQIGDPSAMTENRGERTDEEDSLPAKKRKDTKRKVGGPSVQIWRNRKTQEATRELYRLEHTEHSRVP